MAAFPLPPTSVDRLAVYDPVAIRGDASARKYWRIRLEDDRSAVLCGYPSGMRKSMGAHLESVLWLEEHGFPVPAIYASDTRSGWAVFEDFGDKDGEAALREVTGTERFSRACSLLEPLRILAEIPSKELPGWNDPLDTIRLRWELAGFELWVWGGDTPKGLGSDLGDFLDRLCRDAGNHPTTVCHRDYHLNNIHLTKLGNVGVIDVQDLRLGPDTYDLATLLVDRALPELLAADQWEAVLRVWEDRTSPEPGWRERLTTTMLQRSLKVLANFALFCLHGRTSYGAWVPGMARRAAALATKIEGSGPLATFLLNLASAGGFDVRHTRST